MPLFEIVEFSSPKGHASISWSEICYDK